MSLIHVNLKMLLDFLIVMTNEQVANYNHEQLTKLDYPIAHISARHSSALAKKMSSDDMSGLESVVFVAKGARVMLTINFWSSVASAMELQEQLLILSIKTTINHLTYLLR